MWGHGGEEGVGMCGRSMGQIHRVDPWGGSMGRLHGLPLGGAVAMEPPYGATLWGGSMGWIYGAVPRAAARGRCCYGVISWAAARGRCCYRAALWVGSMELFHGRPLGGAVAMGALYGLDLWGGSMGCR